MTNVPTLEGFGCRLRPVAVGDAEFIVKLRNQPHAKGYIHATPFSVDDQIKWITEWQKRLDDYYWLIETVGEPTKPIGTLGLYDFSKDKTEAMPGRWVMLPQSEVNIMAPFLLMYKFAFEELKLNRVILCVITTNKKVIHFHDLCGARRIARPARYSNDPLDQVWFDLDAQGWRGMERNWAPVISSL